MFTSVTADFISHNPGWIGASAWAALAAKMDAPAMAAAANWRMDILPIEIVARPCSSSLNSGFQCLGATPYDEAMSIQIRTSLSEPETSPMFMPHRPERPPKSEGGKKFKLVSDYQPSGDQPTAIAELVAQAREGERNQVLLGVTGSGKTFTMAKVVEALQRPALVLAPNKILAAQLYGEFKSFFPENAVEYFVSYYDYYQPEAYVPRSDTYIEKESSVNEAIDRMRHSATRSLLERDDVIIVASVSCIYGIGSVETYSAMVFGLKKGETVDQRDIIRKLVALQYKRNDQAFARGNFRVSGDKLEIFPSHSEDPAWRLHFFGVEWRSSFLLSAGVTGSVTWARSILTRRLSSA